MDSLRTWEGHKWHDRFEPGNEYHDREQPREVMHLQVSSAKSREFTYFCEKDAVTQILEFGRVSFERYADSAFPCYFRFIT